MELFEFPKEMPIAKVSAGAVSAPSTALILPGIAAKLFAETAIISSVLGPILCTYHHVVCQMLEDSALFART